MTATNQFPEDVAPASLERSSTQLSSEETRLVEVFLQALSRPFAERDASRTGLLKALPFVVGQEPAFLEESQQRQVSHPSLLRMATEVHQALFAFVDSYSAPEPGQYGLALEILANALTAVFGSVRGTRLPEVALRFSDVAALLGISYAELLNWVDAGRISRGVFVTPGSDAGWRQAVCRAADIAHITPKLIAGWRAADRATDVHEQRRGISRLEEHVAISRALVGLLQSLRKEGVFLSDGQGRALRTDDAQWNAFDQPEFTLSQLIPVRVTHAFSGGKSSTSFCVTVRLSGKVTRPTSASDVAKCAAHLTAPNSFAHRKSLEEALLHRLESALTRFATSFPAESVEKFATELQRELSGVLVPDDLLKPEQFFRFTPAPIARLATSRWAATYGDLVDTQGRQLDQSKRITTMVSCASRQTPSGAAKKSSDQLAIPGRTTFLWT